MEFKKNPTKDLSKWKGTLTHLGLAMSIGAVLVAFEWKAYEEKPLITISEQNTKWEEDFVPPITIVAPPPPPLIPTQVIILEDDQKIDQETLPDIDIDFSESEPIIDIPIGNNPPIIDKADEILDYTEEMSSFKGGMDAWYLYLKSNLNYPLNEQKLGVEGTVLLRFVINTDGSIQDVQVIRSPSEGLSHAAMTVIENSPKWNPGKSSGRPVRSRMTIPIRFKLN